MNKTIELSKQEALDKIDNKYSQLKSFLSKVNSYYIAYNELTKELVFDEVDFGKRQFMIIIPAEIKNKIPKVVFRDDLTDYNTLHELYSMDIAEGIKMYSKLVDNIESLGCELYSSGEGNDDYLWYDLYVPMNIFNEELLTKCEKLWSSYNEELGNMI